MRRLPLAVIATLAISAATVAAQHEEHQMSAAPAVAAIDAATCAENARQARVTLKAALQRLERTRQANDAAAMRTTVDDLQSALGLIDTRLGACVAPATQQPAGTPPTPAAPEGTAGMDHSKMAGMDHSKMDHSMMDHSKMAGMTAPLKMSEDAAQLSCGGDQPKLTAATAPRATYQGKTYYFCSESDRQKFVADPARYLK